MARVTSLSRPNAGLSTKVVFTLATVCLLVGLVVGYALLDNRANPTVIPQPVTASARGGTTGNHPALTLDQMKQMADMQASALVEKSKVDPKNASLLIQIAGIYQASHQFKEAATYFERALQLDPKNVAARTQMASCLFYSDDVDGAIALLNQALQYNPNDVNALFNLGMIKYRGKQDASGAIAVWQHLLNTNPNLDRRPIVEQMIAEAKASMKN